MDYRIKPARNFRDLLAWQIAYKLTLYVYELTKSFPSKEDYGLTSQIKRASVSITSNIAEGFGRRTLKEKDSFYSIAHGSLTEVENQLIIAEGVGYINKIQFAKAEELFVETHKLLYGLRKANKEKGEIAD
ncbi:MAG: four helix bundle protein [Candidatus Saccharibacteria bacterium]